jgi:hypothetical protein
MNNEIVPVKESQQAIVISPDAPPMVQIAQMMQAGLDIDVDKMTKLQEIGERYEANEARKAFASDFTQVQSKVDAVIKTKNNNQTNSKYAGLDDVLEMAKPIYTEHGFSVIYFEGTTELTGNMRLCADILHKCGHKETYHLDIALGGKGIQGKVNMTEIHAKATSVSYGRRYLMCMIWNIPTADDDGNQKKKPAAMIAFPTELEWECVDAIIEKLPPEPAIDREKLAKWFLADKGKYPSTKERVHDASEYVMQKNPTNIYKEQK